MQDEGRVGRIHDLCSVGKTRGPQFGRRREDVQEAGGVVVVVGGGGVLVGTALPLAVGVAEVCSTYLGAVGLAEDGGVWKIAEAGIEDAMGV